MFLWCFFFGFNTSFSAKPPAWCVSCYLLTTHTPTSFPLPPSISVWTLYSLKTSKVIIFFWLGFNLAFFFNYSTLSYSHDCFTRPFFLPTNASFVFASFDFFFIRVSQSSVLLFLYLLLLLTWPLNPPALPRFQHQFKLPSQIHSHHRTSTIFGRRLEAVSVARS